MRIVNTTKKKIRVRVGTAGLFEWSTSDESVDIKPGEDIDTRVPVDYIFIGEA